MFKISVIMPVFNDEKYIEEALNSIYNQTLTDIEVICINDGSTDNSLDIINSFKDKFNELKIINQKNLGSGVARNNGMNIANGEYIAFLDADDIFVDDNALEEMFNLAKSLNADMVSANLKGITVNGEIVDNEVLTRFVEQKIIFPEEYEIPYSYYKNIFKRSFLNENNIVFPDLKRGQDPVFLAEILSKIDCIPVLPIDLYGFRYSPIGGLNKIDTPTKKHDYIKHFKETFDILKFAGYNKMYELYSKKLDEYISFSKNRYDKFIYDTVNEVFKDDVIILNHLKELFPIDNIKVSVILPIFSSENIFIKSINSVLNQTLEDIELICLVDESIVSNSVILNKLEKEQEFIKIIRLKNKNINEVRNFSMKNAIGKFIYFLDEKDKILEDNALENLYTIAERNNADMVSGNLRLINEKNEVYSSDEVNIFQNYGMINPENYGMPIFYQKNLFKKEFLINKNIEFPNLRIKSGSVFLAEVLSEIDKIFVSPITFYEHHQTQVSNPYGEVEIFDNLLHFKMVLNYLNSPKFEKIYQNYRYGIFDFIRNIKPEFSKIFLYSLRKLFSDKSIFLRGCEYYFYYSNKNNSSLKNEIDIQFNIENPRVSIVIPVYNAEDFLEDSIGSLLNQTLKDIELVCVNDGSKDNSLSILKKFASKDNRVKIINQENGGCGAARNKALDNANGDYVYFFDPDDYLVENALEELYMNAIINNSELVLFKLAFWMEGKPIDYSQPHFDLDNYFDGVDFNRFTFNHDDIKRYIMNSRAFAPWFKLYKHDLFKRYDDFYFPINLPFDDVPFHIKSLLRASRMSFVPEFFYHYRIDNPNSVNSTPSNAMGIISIINIVENFLKKENYFNKFEREFYNFKLYHTYIYFFRSSDPEEYFQEVKRQYLKIKSNFFNRDSNNKQFIESFLIEIYEMVINSNSFNEYALNYKLNQITNENQELIRNNQNMSSRIEKLVADNGKLIKENHILSAKIRQLAEDNEKINIADDMLKTNVYCDIDEKRRLNIINKNLINKNKELSDEIKSLKNKRFKLF